MLPKIKDLSLQFLLNYVLDWSLKLSVYLNGSTGYLGVYNYYIIIILYYIIIIIIIIIIIREDCSPHVIHLKFW